MSKRNQKNIYYNGIKNLLKADVVLPGMTPKQEDLFTEELRKCKKNIPYFLKRHVKIVHQERGKVPFELYHYQKKFIKLVQKHNRFIALQARQSGKTAAVAGYILHFIVFNKYKNVTILANKGAKARKILHLIKEFYKSLPIRIQRGVKEWNKGSIELGNGCFVEAMATTDDSARGDSISLLYIDECVKGNTKITVRNKNTGKIEKITIEELKDRLIKETKYIYESKNAIKKLRDFQKFIKNFMITKIEGINPNFGTINKCVKNNKKYIIDSIIYHTKNIFGYDIKKYSLHQRLYHIYKNNFNIPNCKNKKCNNIAIFYSFKNGYRDSCSKSCSNIIKQTGLKQSKEHIENRISKLRGIKNPKHSKFMKDLWRNDEEYRNKVINNMKIGFINNNASMKLSKNIKKRILNREFTPNITNSWTHWDAIINNKRFRSSFEGIFHLYHVIFKQNMFLKYERLRIKYYDSILKKERIYIVDFIDEEKKILYEIKPSSLKENQNNIDKFKYAKRWCINNDYIFKIIDENYIFNLIKEMDENNFKHDFLLKFKEKYNVYI